MPDPRPPADSLNSALERVIAPDSNPPADGVAAAVAQFAATLAEPADAVAPVRLYRPWEVGRVLAAAAALLLALDSDGLLTWSQRMDLGPVQAGLQAVLSPLNAGLDALGLTLPRRWMRGEADRLGRALGGGEDPLIAGGWTAPGELPAPAGPGCPTTRPRSRSQRQPRARRPSSRSLRPGSPCCCSATR